MADSGTDWTWVAMLTLGITAAVALLLVYPAMVLRKYVRILIHIMDDVAPVVENGNGEGPKLEGEKVSFRATDGHGLEGVILSGQTTGAKLGMVVFAHEFGSDRSSCQRYCRPLLEAGYDVFGFDFRGHGASPSEPGYRPRQWPSDREQADMLGAIAFIGCWLEQHDRSRDVGLFGISRGGGAAILASIGIPAVKAIVTDGAFSSDAAIEYLMRRFATIFAKIRVVAENHPPTFWRFLRWLLFRECRRKFHCTFPSVRKAVVKLKRKPMLLIHGEKDSYIPIAQSQALYEVARGPKYLWAVPNASHNQGIMVQPKEYARQVLRFFGEHLATAAEPAAESAVEAMRSPSILPPKKIPTQYVGAAAGATVHHTPGQSQ